MVTAFAQAAERRATIPDSERIPFVLVADEFQNFATESFASILAEARKFKLSLIMAHQFLGQLPEQLRQAVFGNVGTLMAFRVGAEDAPLLARELGLKNPEALSDLPNYEAWQRAGGPYNATRIQTAPPAPSFSRLAAVRTRTKHRYCRPLPQIDREIRDFLSAT